MSFKNYKYQLNYEPKNIKENGRGSIGHNEK